MARFNTDVLRIKLGFQDYDRATKSYSGDFVATLGCTACDIAEEFPVHWPPESYDGPPATSPQMLDDNAWVLAGISASQLCVHVDKKAH